MGGKQGLVRPKSERHLRLIVSCYDAKPFPSFTRMNGLRRDQPLGASGHTWYRRRLKGRGRRGVWLKIFQSHKIADFWPTCSFIKGPILGCLKKIWSRTRRLPLFPPAGWPVGEHRVHVGLVLQSLSRVFFGMSPVSKGSALSGELQFEVWLPATCEVEPHVGLPLLGGIRLVLPPKGQDKDMRKPHVGSSLLFGPCWGSPF